MDGFIKVHITHAGGSLDCWQQVSSGVVVAYVDASSQPVALPAVFESSVVDGALQAAPM